MKKKIILLEDKIKNSKYLSRNDINRMIDVGKTYQGKQIYVHNDYLVMINKTNNPDEYFIQSYWKYDGGNKK